ncbi:MAG: hypothetical protein KGK10_04790 [Rhodospirillales bacterium]|nr:hypothetical protein [Rhodospirillales bacterium]
MRLIAGAVVLAMAVPATAQTLSPPPAAMGQTAAPTTLPGPEQLGHKLPAPPVPVGATIEDYLVAARHALDENNVPMATEALEQAETRALTRSVRPSRANVPDRGGLVGAIAATRAALGRGDRAGADASLARAMELAKKP